MNRRQPFHPGSFLDKGGLACFAAVVDFAQIVKFPFFPDKERRA